MEATPRSALMWPAIAWAVIVVATGFYVDSGAGMIGGAAAAVAVACLSLSLKSWWRLAALPLYILFVGEIIAAASSLLTA